MAHLLQAGGVGSGCRLSQQRCRHQPPGWRRAVKPQSCQASHICHARSTSKRSERARILADMEADADVDGSSEEAALPDSDLVLFEEITPDGEEASSVMATALTADELEEIQRALVQAIDVDEGRQASGFAAGSQEEATDEDEPQGPEIRESDRATDKERVYLVGVDLWARQDGNQTSSNRQSSRSSSGVAVSWESSASKDAAAQPATTLQKKRQPVRYSVEESMEELGRLADTAGLRVVGSTYQSLEVPSGSTYIGSGKVAEVSRAVKAYNAETVIFDCELSPGQLRNLERMIGGEDGAVRVCDRTALILDIFNQRAATREGKLQVELAQVEYQLPRLTRMWTHLDRVGGGGQVKGAGEKQIEMDKRLLRDKAAALRKELEAVRGHRRAYRERRAVAPIPVVALVGYTNAGKSTLLNRLTDAGVLAEDKLFATLDPTTRKIRLKGNRELLVSDTVGFIQKLPTELVAAFRATLEEVQDASVLLHLVDISHPNAAAQCEAVLQVLDELGVSDIPLVTAWNKLDACVNPDQVRAVAAKRRDTVCVSGQTGEGVSDLLDLISHKLAASMVQVEVLLPYSAGSLLDDIHTAGQILGEVLYTDEGSRVHALVPASLAGRLRQYSVAGEAGEVQAKAAAKLLDEWDGAEAEFVVASSADEDDARLV